VTAPLDRIGIGATGVIRGFAPGQAGYRRKLLSMGLTPGTPIRVVRVAPMGDPIEIEVRGYNLSLRRAEADILLVEQCQDHDRIQ